MKVSVIIVNHNAADCVRAALRSLPAAAPGLETESIVMDNSDAPQPITEADVWESVPNNGFGAGCNAGAGKAAGELLLFLNPDTELRPGALTAAVNCLLKEHDCGLTGLRTLRPDGSVEPGCLRGIPTPGRALCYFAGLEHLFPKSRLCGGYHMTWLPRDRTAEVDAVSGSFMLLRRELFERLGGFDESFFMYGEDLDLCRRVQKAGLRVLYCAEGELLHLSGACGRNPRQTSAFYDSMLLYYDKHLAAEYSRFTGAAVRFAVKLLRRCAMRRAAGA